MISSRLSKRYAKALFSIGQEDGRYTQYGTDLAGFAEFCRANEEFGKVVANPIFSLEDRRQILRTILQRSDYADMVKNFLYLLLDKNRIGAISSETVASMVATFRRGRFGSMAST